MSLLAKLSKKAGSQTCPLIEEFKAQPKLCPLVVVQEDIVFLKLNFGSHYIEFKLDCVIEGGASMLDIFQFYLEILGEDAQTDEEEETLIWRKVTFKSSCLFGDPEKGKATFTLFCPEPPAPLFLWKERK